MIGGVGSRALAASLAADGAPLRRLPLALAMKAPRPTVEPPPPAEGPSSGPRPVALLRSPLEEPLEELVHRALTALAREYDFTRDGVVSYPGRPLPPAEEDLPDWGELAGGRGRDRA